MLRHHEAVVVHDRTADLVYANDAAARWLGFPSPEAMLDAAPSQLLSRFQLWTEEGAPLDEGQIAAFLGAGSLPQRALLRADLGEGEDARWVVLSSEPIRGPDDRLLYAVTTVEDVTELKRSEFAQQLLARTGELLASPIDHRETLRAVPRIAVPRFADWCSVSIPGPDGVLQQVAIAHTDSERLALVNQLRERYPVRIDDPGGVAEVI